MQKHLLSCLEEKQRCSNHNCPESIKRSDLQRHVEEECSYRLQRCPLCGESMTAAVLKVSLCEKCMTVTPLSVENRTSRHKRYRKVVSPNEVVLDK